MAVSPSPILSYADNVVATYDPATTKAVYQNADINNDLIVDNNLNVNNLATINELEVAGYKLPVSGYAPLADDDYIAYDSTANGGVGGFVFKNFSTAGVTISNVGGLTLPVTKSNGTILHMANSASEIVADPTSEYTIIDGKSPVLIADLKLTDRLLVSVDKPGAGTGLYKLSLSNLFKFIETSTSNLSVIKSLASNTSIDAKDTTIDLTIDDGLGSAFRVSTLANTGMTLHGNLFFNTDTDLGANASLEVTGNGFLLRRFSDSLDFEFDATQNFILRNDLLQLGPNFVLANNAFIDLDINSSISLGPNKSVSLDQSLLTTDNVTFASATVSGTLNANTISTVTDVNSTRDTIAGRDVSAARDLIAGNTVFTLTSPIITSSVLYKENIKSFDNGLNYIMNMKPVQYDRKNNVSKNEIGFIAEEMETVLPSIVKMGQGVKGIQYDQIVPVLVSALQEQQKRIEELENKVK